jgi:hypothetical protein
MSAAPKVPFDFESVTSKLRVSKRGAAERVFGRLGGSAARHHALGDGRGRGRDRDRDKSGGGGGGKSKEKGRVKQTFVDSLPAAAAALDAAARALKDECYATLGPRAHVVLDGTAWSGGAHETAAHAAFLERRLPWAFYAAEGAADVLDSRQDSNPHVQLGVAGRDRKHLHALVTTFIDATALWPEAGRRVVMGKRADADATPADTRAPLHFATQHAVLLRARPLQWAVPSAYDGVVSRVIARLEDADVETRFWVVCPVKSELLRPDAPEWFAFCESICAAARVARPLPRCVAVLLPIVPGLTQSSAVHCVEDLEHACVHAARTGLVLPPARILEARLSGYLRLDESGADPASFQDEEEEEEEDGEGEGEGEETETPSARVLRALAFSPTDDLFVAVCDTRISFPLVTFVVQNGDMRRFVFRDAPADDDEHERDGDSGDRGRDGRDDVYDWGQFQDAYDWLAWTADM